MNQPAPGMLVTPTVRLVERVSGGAMGSVWLADHLGLHTQVMVKFIAPEVAASPEVVMLGHDAWGARRVIRRVYLQRIRGAERRVLIANSYFIPDGAMYRALERAARRGVEVRVIIPRVSDVPVVTWAARHLYSRMMKAGVHVHEYLGRVLHSKTALIDDWATTGSYNLDSLSWRSNLEANMATTDAGFVRAMQDSFERDLADCEEVDPVAWGRRPWADKLRSWGWYLFRKFL